MTAPLRVGDDIEDSTETPFLGEPGERPRRRSSDTKECATARGSCPGTIRKTRRPLFVDRDMQSPVGDAPAGFVSCQFPQ
jgi:hypothetical protein